MKFLDGLSEDIKNILLRQLSVYWTYSTTAIEGNTLTMGETEFVISEGLTVSGKSLKDHKDIEGHARAVDFMYGLLQKNTIEKKDLFDIHELIISEKVIDAYSPVGNWKKSHNSTSMFIDGKQTIINYSPEWETPQLMDNWLLLLNEQICETKTMREALVAYSKLHVSFVSIHPFYDGNGRIARLISNMPCLKAGFPPIIVDNTKKLEYKQLLASYQIKHGVPSIGTKLIHEEDAFEKITQFFENNWQSSIDLVEQAQKNQIEIDLAREKHMLKEMSR